MKKTMIGLALTMALVLSLGMGISALAENTVPEELEKPAEEELQQGQMPLEDGLTSPDALQEALKAYREARASSRLEDLEEELKSYVEAGKMTQEQADLILTYWKEHQSLRDGTGPKAGSQFRNKQDRGSRTNTMPGGKRIRSQEPLQGANGML